MTRLLVLTYLLLFSFNSLGSGGYENGSPAGRRHLALCLTWNPFNYFTYGQSYAVVGYGLTDHLDIHGFYSVAANGHVISYAGFKFNFLQTKFLDLSTAFGVRSVKPRIDLFVPQLLYTIKLPKSFELFGAFVGVDNINVGHPSKIAVDLGLRIPLNFKWLPSYVTDCKFALSMFRSISGNWYPTYSLDFNFGKPKKPIDE